MVCLRLLQHGRNKPGGTTPATWITVRGPWAGDEWSKRKNAHRTWSGEVLRGFKEILIIIFRFFDDVHWSNFTCGSLHWFTNTQAVERERELASNRVREQSERFDQQLQVCASSFFGLLNITPDGAICFMTFRRKEFAWTKKWLRNEIA